MNKDDPSRVVKIGSSLGKAIRGELISVYSPMQIYLPGHIKTCQGLIPWSPVIS